MVNKLNREKLLSHIDSSEKLLEMKKIIDKVEIVLNDYVELSTDFLDPYEVYLAKSILNRFEDISYSVDGGYEESERKIIYIYQSYLYENTINDLVAFQFNLENKISHKDILGSLLGLGIERRKIGDIIISNNVYSFFVKRELSDFIEFNFKKVNKYNVKLERVNSVDIPEKDYEINKLIISSLRLDTFLSNLLRMSRANAQELIKQEKVKVNFKSENKSSYILEEGDLLSIRKFGRFIFSEIEGTTKKDNYIVKIKIPK